MSAAGMAAGRRRVLRGVASAMAAAAGGLSVSTATQGDDARLIALCAKLKPIQHEIETFRERNVDSDGKPLVRDENFERGYWRMIKMERDQLKIIAQTAAFPASTLAGLAARAKAIAIMQPELLGVNDEGERAGDASLNMVAILLRDLGAGS